ncbi:unnamed protein product [Aureobasidium pullulans]|nr:unnamed protein product [Aureobasidium pullulans]
MATKQELITQKYLLLSVIHLNGFEMSTQMAELVFSRWPPAMGDRPTSAQEILKTYDKTLHQKSVQSTHMASHDLDSCQQPDHPSQAARKPDIVPFSPVHPESQPIRKPIYVPFDNDYDIEQSDDDEKNQQRSQSPEETPSKKQRTE